MTLPGSRPQRRLLQLRPLRMYSPCWEKDHHVARVSGSSRHDLVKVVVAVEGVVVEAVVLVVVVLLVYE